MTPRRGVGPSGGRGVRVAHRQGSCVVGSVGGPSPVSTGTPGLSRTCARNRRDQLRSQRGGHRPPDDAAAEGIEHHGAIEKAGPSRNVNDIGHPQPIRRLCREVAVHQVRRLTAIALDRGDNELASAKTGKAGLRHQPHDVLAARRAFPWPSARHGCAPVSYASVSARCDGRRFSYA